MKKIIATLIYTLSATIFAFAASTVDIPSGTFYFDNTNTGYTQPKFTYGNSDKSYIENMEWVEGDVWKITHDTEIRRMLKYFFTDTSLDAGEYEVSILSLKDIITLTRGEHRTATSTDKINTDYIFVPEEADNWNQGEWKKYEEGGSDSDYCIAGNGGVYYGWCCGLGWDPSNCPLGKGDSITVTLPAGTYIFKITKGSWYENWGYPDVNKDLCSVTCYGDDDDNVNFKLTEQHAITIKFIKEDGTIVVTQDGVSPSPTPTPTPTCSPASGTIPIMYMYTDGGAEIESTEEYVDAKFYIDASMAPGYKSAGRKDSMLVTQIKGRGNYTWTGFDKKPYRIKLDVKKKLLGLTKDKNYTLLAHADDTDAFLRNTLGFRLSELFDLDYTPEQEPFEFFINDQYQGIYFLTDKIKIGTNRVKITEQPDGSTDPSIVTGGWLLEIDNYWEDSSIQFQMIEKGSDWLLVTCHSPEDMSNQQYSYMENYLYNTNEAIHNGGWENYIYIDTLVNFYLVQEIMGNHESFHGSCYMHKERGNDTKLAFGPVWDFGSSLHTSNGYHIYEAAVWGDTWIDDLAEYDSFQEKCAERWLAVRGILYPELKKCADDFITKITSAAACDLKKWPEYGNSKLEAKKTKVLSYLNERMQWLDTNWGTTDVTSYSDGTKATLTIYPNPTDGVINLYGIDNAAEIYVTDMGGRVVRTLDPSQRTWNLNLEKGTYILNVLTDDGSFYNGKLVNR